MIFSIAWRNIWRNRIRSLVVITAIALGLWGGIFSYAFMQGMAGQQMYASIHTETGHIQINQKDFLLNYDMQLNIADSKKTEQEILAIPGVKGVTSGIQTQVMASTTHASAGITLNGIDPESFNTVSELNQYLTSGTFFGDKKSHPVVIGEQLADKLHAKIHSHIIVGLQNYTGELTSISFRVVGIYKLQNSDFNERMVFVRKNELQESIGFPDDHVSAINVLLTSNDSTNQIKNKIAGIFPGLSVQTWQEISPMMQIMSGTINQMSMIFVFIILLALAFGIINTMLMAVMERTREIGMLLCIGMNQIKVFFMIVLETLFLSLTGAIIGLGLSIATVYYFGKHGIDLSVVSDGINAFGFSSHVYPELDSAFYPQFALMVIFIAIFSSFFPARRAIKLKPAEAVRGE